MERMQRLKELVNQITSGSILAHGIEEEQEWTKKDANSYNINYRNLRSKMKRFFMKGRQFSRNRMQNCVLLAWCHIKLQQRNDEINPIFRLKTF